MEKNILAYFKSPEEAEGAAQKLHALRAIDVSIDRISKYPGGGGGAHAENPVSGDFGSLAALTLGADVGGNSPGILLSAGTDASGMSDGGQGGPTGRDVLLTAVVDEGVHRQALSVIEQAGGAV
ncbi:hypothetical protein FE782_05640 [Paenibacillus antri]|uniref:Uncharacterized protein n=1 Tax=Paenibacillus antri TaxID=2582848 RepID=A0A5R9GF16_9BACL|nr:hypothetical protein [Paenibacillus antri]TLS53749.1 hypothetical protein FE782_05640 [Paenibacillus antri]